MRSQLKSTSGNQFDGNLYLLKSREIGFNPAEVYVKYMCIYVTAQAHPNGTSFTRNEVESFENNK